MTQKWTVEPSPRHVRVEFAGQIIADSKNVTLLRESRYELYYLFPQADVRMDLLQESDHTEESGYKGTSTFWHVQVGAQLAQNAAWTYRKAKEGRPDLQGLIGFAWDKMDKWYEEDEEVFLHPRDPYHRVDAVPSSRHIQVLIDGETVAETQRPVLIFETDIITRYYIPQADVRMDLMIPTTTQSICPYKGFASYLSVKLNGDTYEDVVWTYPDPIPEMPKIKDLMAFWPEKDKRIQILVDGAAARDHRNR